MATTVMSGTIVGVEAQLVRVEVDLVRRLPRVTVVGLPADSVREATERIRSAILSSELEFPKLRVTINLAPAALRKGGAGLDLPMALGILAASGQIPEDALDNRLFSGELSLHGQLRSVPGALPLAMLARELGYEAVVLPAGSAGQGAVVPGLQSWRCTTLREVVDVLCGRTPPTPAQPQLGDEEGPPLDLADVRGQPLARRALEISAAGGHNLLMIGPPGVGKTMLATRLPTILPRMSFDEALSTTRVHSVAGLLPEDIGLLQRRPFRAPHYSISAAGLLGGARLQPGELSLAHNGVLFLDEIAEFPRSVLEQLRAPLESREVLLVRAAGAVRFPAACTLIAAANPCPCGYLGHPLRPCGCTDAQVQRYRQRLSGPLLDRFDLHVQLDPVAADDLAGGRRGEDSRKVRARVLAAREMQQARYKGDEVYCNAQLDGPQARIAAAPTRNATGMLKDAVGALGLSARAYDRVLKVARTLADLDGTGPVDVPHVAEALGFRPAPTPEEALCPLAC